MTATIDKFGRIVIPKAIRDELGIKLGAKLELILDDLTGGIIIQPVSEMIPSISVDDFGIPVIEFGIQESIAFDIVADIQEGREERAQKILGNG